MPSGHRRGAATGREGFTGGVADHVRGCATGHPAAHWEPPSPDWGGTWWACGLPSSPAPAIRSLRPAPAQRRRKPESSWKEVGLARGGGHAHGWGTPRPHPARGAHRSQLVGKAAGEDHSWCGAAPTSYEGAPCSPFVGIWDGLGAPSPTLGAQDRCLTSRARSSHSLQRRPRGGNHPRGAPVRLDRGWAMPSAVHPLGGHTDSR